MLTRADGSEERFPHLVTDRAKPGVIAVNQRAVRFVNESSSYHHFASAMQDAAENAPCFLLCDAQAMKRYGLGWHARRRSIMTPWSPPAICTKPIPWPRWRNSLVWMPKP
ncbi:fumarate reductase/succinate dehydrogenase flavoprotein domain-containing protein [Klebsiella pneumoniae]|uniref:Fumarate reductase/succinate dehydrogenase flavoprotein domain-containing protein n=1 Tax=Klebsiella pneumoniae TaxID=573 RepID=A0A2X3CBH3_KLEPN|nr:fumarate reductase/succinate dehydrogenase flavoprotein domain-containing protein [Klebsiella pneumoniae]